MFKKLKTMEDYKNIEIKYDEGKNDVKGSILLIHGTAPQNIDGVVPIPQIHEALKEKDPSHYIINPTYKELSHHLNESGWNTLRYTRTGVYSDSVNLKEYGKTNLNNIMTQLNLLFESLPQDKPVYIFAWSGGSIHILQLPLHKVDGIMILGGIATKRTDLHNYSDIPEEIKKEIQKQLDEIIAMEDTVPRTEMVNLDMPFGRFYDENNLNDNWEYLKDHRELPVLILHGSKDAEVHISQSELWKKNLPEHNIERIIGENRNHAWGLNGNEADPENLAKALNEWLIKIK